MLDALLDRPMKEVLAELPLANDIDDAVRRCGGPLGGPLACVIAWERGNWTAIDVALRDVPATGDELASAYLRAIEWARNCGSLVH